MTCITGWKKTVPKGQGRGDTMSDVTLDATGLKCPLPVLKADKAVRQMAGGGTLEVLATDPGSVEDFAAFCETGGHEMLEQTEDGGVYRFLIRAAG
jgi:tRNA 2-thiouridine synthesizing protein A